MYEKERGSKTGNSDGYPSEWSNETDVGEKHKGIGLMYPSDYGYATNGGEKGREECFEEELYNWRTGEYKSECANNDWLKPSSGYNWTLSPFSSYSHIAFDVGSGGFVGDSGVYGAGGVAPVGYLLPSVTIYDGDGTFDNPYKLR